MSTVIDLDHRVTALEDLYTQKMHPKMESMNWAIGEVHADTKSTRADIRHVYNALDTMRGRITSLEGTLERETSELRNNLAIFEANAHSVRAFREEVNERFERAEDRMNVRFEEAEERTDARFKAVDARFQKVDERFDRMDAKLDELLAAVRPRDADT